MFDRIGVYSTEPADQILRKLPVRFLVRRCHDFQVRDLEQQEASYKSCMEFTDCKDPRFWHVLLRHESDFGKYRITKLELAFDFPAKNKFGAAKVANRLGQRIRKLWHSRKELMIVSRPSLTAPAGIIEGPTFYFEDRTATTNIKTYARYAKVQRKKFDMDRPVARVEWTLTKAVTIKSKTKISNLSDLRKFDPNAFLKRYFRLEKLNLQRFGMLVANRPNRRARHRPGRNKYSYDRLASAANIFFRIKAYRESSSPETFEVALSKWRSSAHVRGYLRKGMIKAQHTPGRKSVWLRKMKKLTDYKLNQIFDDCTPTF